MRCVAVASLLGLVVLSLPLAVGAAAATRSVGNRTERGPASHRLVALGGLDLDAYCRSVGYDYSDTMRPRGSPGAAYNNWFCFAFDGRRAPIDLLAACQATYRQRPIAARPTDPSDANTWVCYRIASKQPLGGGLFTARHCAAVLIVGARGSGEDPKAYRGMGSLLYTLAQVVARKLPRVRVAAEGLDYTAVAIVPGQPNFLRKSYSASVTEGVRALRTLIQRRHEACPRELWVLAGFSQGAQVVGNALYEHLTAGDQVAAVELFGDPLYSPNSPSDRGGGRNWGILNRDHKRERPPAAWVARTESWCNPRDAICGGIGLGRTLSGHGEYPKIALPGASSFAAGKVRIRL